MFAIQCLSLKVKSVRNRFRKSKKQFLFSNFFHGAIFLLGLALLYFFLITMFDFAARGEMPAFDFACIMLSFCLLVFLPLLVYSGIVCALSVLFQKEQIAFYLSLPVNRMQVFMVKFWETFFHTTWMAFCGLLIFIFAIQSYFSLSPLIYLSGVISGFVFFLIPVCLAVIVVCLLSCFIPFVRAKGVLTVVGLLIGSLILLVIRLIRPERLITHQGKMRLLTFAEDLHKPWMTILPSEWLTNIFAAHYQADITGVLLNFFILFVTAFILLIITYFLAKAFYVRIWSESITVPEAGVKKTGWQVFLRFFPSSVQMLVRKDLLSFYRNTVERGSLLIFIPLGVVYFYSMHVIDVQIHSYPEEPIFSFLYLYLFNFFYSAVVLCGLSGRWVFPSISAEGNNFNLIRLSPLPLTEFMQEKFWLGFLPLLILGEILVIGSCFILGFKLLYIAIAFFAMVILALGITVIGLILGARMADFSKHDSLEFALSYQGFIYLVRVLIFVGTIILLLAIPLVQFLRSGISLSFVLLLISTSAVIISIFYGLYLSYRRSIACLSKREI